ncbi:ATP-binding protein [Halomonas organivorans]
MHTKKLDKDRVFFLCSSYQEKSKNSFRGKLEGYEELVRQLVVEKTKQREEEVVSFKRHLHNLVSLNAVAIQSVYANIPQESFIQKKREELISAITRHVRSSPEESAKLVIDLLKNEILKKAELSAYNKIFQDEAPDIFSYPAHKIVLLVLNSFWDEFREKDVRVSLDNFYKKVLIDFDAFAAVLTHIFHNSSKYILPKSKLFITFEELEDGFVKIGFEMTSLRIRDDEKSLIFKKDFSGSEPKRLKRHGEGLGLWVVTELLSSMQGRISVEADVDKRRRRNKMGVNYELNRFNIFLPRG